MGAWIETRLWLLTDPNQNVAPYVGAWIETSSRRHVAQRFLSHPMWVRGLKHSVGINLRQQVGSHPMWVRGLKHVTGYVCPIVIVSHPMWVRGLKPAQVVPVCLPPLVAPYVGAWIET